LSRAFSLDNCEDVQSNDEIMCDNKSEISKRKRKLPETIDDNDRHNDKKLRQNPPNVVHTNMSHNKNETKSKTKEISVTESNQNQMTDRKKNNFELYDLVWAITSDKMQHPVIILDKTGSKTIKVVWLSWIDDNGARAGKCSISNVYQRTIVSKLTNAEILRYCVDFTDQGYEEIKQYRNDVYQIVMSRKNKPISH